MMKRSNTYTEDVTKSTRSGESSPAFEMLNVAKEVGVFDICMDMIKNGNYYSKDEWRRIV